MTMRKIMGIMVVVVALGLGACSTTDESAMQEEQTTQQDAMTGTDMQGQGLEGVDMMGMGGGTQQDLVVNVGDRVFFGFDRYDLTPEARMVLDRQAEWLKRYPSLRVTIEGHADERGTREYNLALGERRANSVRNYLVALGVDAARINTISYGKERPAVLGSNERAWAQNRRGVTKVE